MTTTAPSLRDQFKACGKDLAGLAVSGVFTATSAGLIGYCAATDQLNHALAPTLVALVAGAHVYGYAKNVVRALHTPHL